MESIENLDDLGSGNAAAPMPGLSITLQCSWTPQTYVDFCIFILIFLISLLFYRFVLANYSLLKKTTMGLYVLCQSVYGNFNMESPRVDCCSRSRAAESSISVEKIWYRTKHRFDMPI